VSKENLNSGKRSEAQAELFLKRRGYVVLERNYKTRSAEIDIVAREKGAICFVEVKSRSSERFGSPQEAVTPAKQAKIATAARVYLQEHNLLERRVRFDVVAIVQGAGEDKISLVKGAFEPRE